MPKRLVLCCALLAVSTSSFAQSNGIPAAPELSLWDHNGSVVSLVAQGALREFHYKEPRPAMVEAGARPGSVLFRGKVENGHYAGTAFMFDRRCGQISYAVSGPILDSDQRVVLSGEAPLVGAKCRVQGSFTEVLEFRLQNANRTAKAMAPESAPSPSLQTDERAAAAVPAPPAPPSEARPASPNPSAVIAELAPVQKQAAAPTALPPAPNPPAVAGDRALAQKQAAVSPPPPSAPNLPAAVTDHGPAQKQAALSLAAPPPAANPDLAAEIERTRAAREQAATATDAARAAELAAHRAFAEAEATRAAAEARLQQSRDDLQAANGEDAGERSRQTLILAAMSWTLLLSGVAIVLLLIKLRRSQSFREAENAKTGAAFAATMTGLPLYSRSPKTAAKADASNAAKSHGYQSGGRMRVFFQTRPAQHPGNAPHLGRAGYSPR